MIFVALCTRLHPFLLYCLTCGNKMAEIPRLRGRCLEKDYRAASLTLNQKKKMVDGTLHRSAGFISWIHLVKSLYKSFTKVRQVVLSNSK